MSEARASRVVPASGAAIAEAAALIRGGRLVVLPTETVYGLGADATNDRAVAEIFHAKGRPQFNPLIVHVRDAGQAASLVEWTANAGRLAAQFWPGPLSLVLKRRSGCPVSLLASAGLDTVAVRSPNHAVAQALLRAADCAIAAPSANRSGDISPTSAQHVEQSLGGAAAMILDGGPCAVGIESTVVDARQPAPVLLRPGAVTRTMIEAAVGPLATPSDGPIRSPGQLAKHYAPRTPLRLDCREVRPGETLLSFGPHAMAGALQEKNLSPSGDLTEAAANLFRYLRVLDGAGGQAIAVMPIPDTDLGEAINDRLRRAAAK